MQVMSIESRSQPDAGLLAATVQIFFKESRLNFNKIANTPTTPKWDAPLKSYFSCANSGHAMGLKWGLFAAFIIQAMWPFQRIIAPQGEYLAAF